MSDSAPRAHSGPHADSLSPPAHPTRHGHGSDPEEPESAEGEWSGQESGGEADQTSSQGARGVKRKRPLMVSCEICKQRKVKCDRAQPSCGWCKRNGQMCEYRERKKPGLRAGYGRELEQRLDRLEEIIQSQARLIETHIIHGQAPLSHGFSHDGAPSYSSPSEPSAAPGPSPRAAALFMQDSSVHSGVQPRATGLGSMSQTINQDLPVNSPSDGSVKSHAIPRRLPNGISPTAVMSHLPETPQNEYVRNESSLKVPVDIFSNQQQSLSDPDLPPYDLLYALVDLYFEHVNTWCPILHRRTTLDSFFGPSPLEEADRVLLYAIVATTLRFSTDARLNEESRQRFHDTAKQRVLLYGIENSSVKALQALVILALDFVGSSNGPPGWKLLALIARSVVQLGLAVESSSSLVSSVYPSIYTLRAVTLPEPSSWTEDESRRRLFWMVYLLDRYSTIATAFDFALDDKDIDRRLPCKDEFYTKNRPVETRWFRSADERTDHLYQSENVGSFGFYVEILGILSRIHIFLKQPVDIGSLSDVEAWQATYRKLESELSSWEFNLPTEYAHENSSRLFSSTKGNRAVHCGWVMLHVTYQTTVIRLHSSAAYPTTRSPIFTPSYSASQRCLVAVNNVISLTHFVLDNHMLDKLGPPFAFSLWVSARLLLVHGSTIAHTVSPDIALFVDTLARMGKVWKVAERYSTILQRVLDEYNDYQHAMNTHDERSTPSSVKILADMRRCAFDLDFLISGQPRAAAPDASGNGVPGMGGDLTGATPSQLAQSLGPAPPSMRNPAPNQLEYLDVFGFFNVPRLPTMPPAVALDGGSNGAANEGGDLSVQDIAGGAGSAEAAAGAVGTVNTNEFNITNYLIPTPETDWLFRTTR